MVPHRAAAGLTGRRVLVVGAGTRPSPEPDPPIGNGRAISVLAAREGAAVACADRDAGAAEATAALVRGEGQSAAVVLADVALPEACASVVTESAAALGGLDGLVLNVGIGLGRGMAGTSAAQWDETFAVNARAHFLVAAAALPVLEPGSAIVFISSAASLRAATGIPAYDASKAALLGVCRQVAREGMARGIRANLVVPSLVDTPLGRDASRLNPGRTARSLPFGRQATAWEVAYAAVWLLSGESSYVNAHPLVLDGGATSFGAIMGLCNPTQTRSRRCRRRARTKPASAGVRRPNQTTRSACAGTGRRTGTSEFRLRACPVVRRE